jgi:hypothetical protein
MPYQVATPLQVPSFFCQIIYIYSTYFKLQCMLRLNKGGEGEKPREQTPPLAFGQGSRSSRRQPTPLALEKGWKGGQGGGREGGREGGDGTAWRGRRGVATQRREGAGTRHEEGGGRRHNVEGSRGAGTPRGEGRGWRGWGGAATRRGEGGRCGMERGRRRREGGGVAA